MITDRLFNRLVLGAVTLGFAALLGVGGLAGWTVHRNQVFSDWVGHTYRVEQAVSDYRILNERTETARRGYLLKRDDIFYTGYQRSKAAIPAALDRISDLTRDNPSQQARVSRLRALTSEQIGLMDGAIAAAHAGDPVAAIQAFRNDRSVSATRTIRKVTVEMAGEEARLLQIRSGDQQASAALLLWVLLGAGVLAAVVAAGSIFIILRYTRDLTASRAALMSLNENLEQAVAERTVDLQRANDEIQRFAYIVSHDLRSPLVNVMGFTSELDAAITPLSQLIDAVEANAPALMSRDARLAVRQDLPEAVGFIRSSTQKMDRLINAILKLSREGRRVLTPERLDVVAIVGGVRDSLRHRTEELGARIDIEGLLPTIVSDRFSVEQILSNLVENAVKYLKPGRPGQITVSGKTVGGRVIYAVADNGRGIDPRDHERIFDLFRRSGAQDQPGEGIGLAHVRALAYRLGGTISCESQLDQGAVFRVSLPQILQPD
jgi:signal transduction histidine kinase